MTKRPLILDTDGGVDDAQALCMLVANGRAPVYVTTVFGNVGLDAATRNILDVLSTLGADIPVHKGADRPMVQPIIDAKEVHGEDGLGGAPRPASRAEPASSDGIGVLRKTFREAAARGDKVDIIMIGPLTNLAQALRLEPSIIAGIGTLTIMGGTVYGRGNTTPAAEFNIYADPEAAQVVFSSDIETVVAPWEPCLTHRISGADLDALAAKDPVTPVSALMKALSDQQRSRYKKVVSDSIGYVDPLAAALALDPTIIVKSISASVAVSLAPGITRGMTVCDISGRYGTRKHTIVETVDQAALDRFYANTTCYLPKKLYETT